MREEKVPKNFPSCYFSVKYLPNTQFCNNSAQSLMKFWWLFPFSYACVSVQTWKSIFEQS